MDRQITNIEQGTSKNEVPNSLSHRESGGERESALLAQNNIQGFHSHPASGHLLPEGERIKLDALGQAHSNLPIFAFDSLPGQG